MFINLKTKELIKPGGRRIKVEVKEGKKKYNIYINDSVLIKYSPAKLKFKFNILPARNVGMKDERYYKNKISEYKETKNRMDIIYKPVPSKTIKELKKLLIDIVGRYYYSLQTNENAEKDLAIFLGKEAQTGPPKNYRTLYLKKKKQIESIKSYDKLVELNLYEEV